jgi:hypothetical protein
MNDVMMTITCEGDTPSLNTVAQMLHVPESALREEFGVVLIDPDTSKYTVLVDEMYAHKAWGKNVEGPFSNPQISTYGPIE